MNHMFIYDGYSNDNLVLYLSTLIFDSVIFYNAMFKYVKDSLMLL